jgi:PAS domain S-box-containing protein
MDTGNQSPISADDFHTIMASSVDGFSLVDANGNIIDANDSYCRMMGYSRKELLKMHFSQIDAFHRAEDVANHFGKIKEKGSLRFETKHLRKDGSVIDVEVTATHSPLRGGSFFSIVREITRQKQIEKALRQSEEKYRNLYHYAEIGIFQSTFDDRFIDVNPALARMMGYDSPEEVVNSVTSISEQVYAAPKKRDAVASEALKTGGIICIENLYRRKDGTLWNGLLHLRIAQDLLGKPHHFEGFIADITDRKKAEHNLRMFKMSVENATDAIAFASPEGKNVYHNEAFSCLFGDIGENPADIYVDKEVAREVFNTIMIGGNWSGEVKMYGKDNRVLDILLRAHANKDANGGIVGLVCIHTDITEQKSNHESLDYVNDCFTQALNGSRHILYRLNVKTGYDYLSPVFEEITGHPVAEFKKVTREKLAEYFHPDDIPPMLSIIDEACRLRTGPEVKMSFEYRLKKADGSYCWLYDSTTACFNDNDELEYFFGSAYDITERKKSEEERLELERQLLHAQKLESLGVMAGGIAHDFNNLLQSILGNMELASNALDSDSKAHKYTSYAMKSAIRAAHLTNLMLTYAGKGFIANKNLNLNNLIEANVEMLKTAASPSVSLKLSLSAEIPDIFADEAQVQQIVMNLITNGAESIDKLQGYVTITTGVTHCDQKYLSASLLDEKPEPGKFVHLEVRDNGCGMNEETIKRLFDPFFTTKFTGRGLGMSAVMGIIKSHNGALFVESKLGKGTTFRILFPVSETTTHAASVFSDKKHLALSGTALSGVALVVDDEKHVLKTCAKMVELIGFRVITARDGCEAVAKYREHQQEIDVVIMDLTMPNMDGITAMGEIYTIRLDAKVILASGYNEEELSKRITGKAPSGFIRKPYNMSALKAELSCQRIVQAD